jgi:hypothetical protein
MTFFAAVNWGGVSETGSTNGSTFYIPTQSVDWVSEDEEHDVLTGLLGSDVLVDVIDEAQDFNINLIVTLVLDLFLHLPSQASRELSSCDLDVFRFTVYRLRSQRIPKQKCEM